MDAPKKHLHGLDGLPTLPWKVKLKDRMPRQSSWSAEPPLGPDAAEPSPGNTL